MTYIFASMVSVLLLSGAAAYLVACAAQYRLAMMAALRGDIGDAVVSERPFQAFTLPARSPHAIAAQRLLPLAA